MLLGPDATKAKLRALDLERYRFVHFATHGWLFGDDASRSGLTLTADSDDAGSALLSREDVVGLRLGSDVVVLSACRSGEGELLRGEGLVGLTRSFLYAGTRSVLVSLWNVGDQSTVDFMTEFYRGMKAGETAAAALRRAKLSFLESERAARRAVRHWAPFILVGNPAPARGAVNRSANGPT
jgi:CHAT domain-containing protein